MSGEDLSEWTLEQLKPGTVWLRGCQQVRIRAATEATVTFSELTHGRADRRRLSRSAFLRTSRPA